MTLCDLSKAFDSLLHDVLLEKLNRYGFRGVALNFISSYLSNRYQKVVIKQKNESSLDLITCGVPQGSILGPLLFIIYMNDLTWFFHNISTYLYADDTALLTSNNDLDTLLQMSEQALNKVSTWFTANKLLLNKNKTQRCVFKYKTPVSAAEPVTSVKCLGIHIDNNLKWKTHIDSICNRLSQILFLLRNVSILFCNID